MKTPHKHAELIKAWADGAEIQSRFVVSNDTNEGHVWVDTPNPAWDFEKIYRIKPEPKPDVIVQVVLSIRGPHRNVQVYAQWSGVQPGGHGHLKPDLQLTFDGETGLLKSVEIVK